MHGKQGHKLLFFLETYTPLISLKKDHVKNDFFNVINTQNKYLER